MIKMCADYLYCRNDACFVRFRQLGKVDCSLVSFYVQTANRIPCSSLQPVTSLFVYGLSCKFLASFLLFYSLFFCLVPCGKRNLLHDTINDTVLRSFVKNLPNPCRFHLLFSKNQIQLPIRFTETQNFFDPNKAILFCRLAEIISAAFHQTVKMIVCY